MVHVVSKESRPLVLPRSSCFISSSLVTQVSYMKTCPNMYYSRGLGITVGRHVVDKLEYTNTPIVKALEICLMSTSARSVIVPFGRRATH
jgi:hypothetical protein